MKALQRQGLLTLPHLVAASDAGYPTHPGPAPVADAPSNQPAEVTPRDTPEIRLASAWKHDVSCQFDFRKIEMLSGECKLHAVSPHFAFIAKHEAIPDDMIDYLRQ